MNITMIKVLKLRNKKIETYKYINSLYQYVDDNEHDDNEHDYNENRTQNWLCISRVFVY